jgi:hypothetical protein
MTSEKSRHMVPGVVCLPKEFDEMLKEGALLYQPSYERFKEILSKLNHQGICGMSRDLFGFFIKNLSEIDGHMYEGGIFNKTYVLTRKILWQMSQSTAYADTDMLKPETLGEIKKQIADTVKTAQILKQQIKSLETTPSLTELKLLTFWGPEDTLGQISDFDDKIKELPAYLECVADCLKKMSDRISLEKGKSKPRSFKREILENLCEIYKMTTGEKPEIKRNGSQLSTNERHRFTLLYAAFIEKFDQIKWPNTQKAKEIVEAFSRDNT